MSVKITMVIVDYKHWCSKNLNESKFGNTLFVENEQEHE